MIAWDARQTAFEHQQPEGSAAPAVLPPLTGTGVLTQGRKEVANVTYIVRTIRRRDPATGESAPQYGGRVDVVSLAEGTGQAPDWSQAEDVVLHLQTHQLRLGVMLSGERSPYALRGRSSLDADHRK
jgi:hypothetical protein